MSLKILGAILIIAGSGGVGYSMVLSHKREEDALKALICAIEFMISELKFRLTALPILCSMASEQITGPVSGVLANLAELLASQNAPDAGMCVEVALKNAVRLPDKTAGNIRRLGQSLGRFDLQGQLSGLQAVAELTQRDLLGMQADRQMRIRAYTTLSLCAGVALVILFV